MMPRLTVLLLPIMIVGLASGSTPIFKLQPTFSNPMPGLLPISDSFCPGDRFPIKTPPLSSEPYIELTVGGKTGPFLIDYGATTSSVEKGLLASSD
ncbi:MAG TPA: hypothetical protein V6C46_03810, partial [Coleofasciculaceae cyanobacterium]